MVFTRHAVDSKIAYIALEVAPGELITEKAVIDVEDAARRFKEESGIKEILIFVTHLDENGKHFGTHDLCEVDINEVCA